MIQTPVIFTPKITTLPLLAEGKVRQNYIVDEQHILMVTTDRISAFDVVMNQPIPHKGALLTQMALFWFDYLKEIIPNHLTGIAPESVVSTEEASQVMSRAMVVKRLKPIMIEAVVRGYITGSGWKEYEQSQSVCGVALPKGLQNADKLSEPIFTPAAKAAVGDHDENITFEKMQQRIGTELAEQIKSVSIKLYKKAAEYALAKGIIIADTKFEFGLDANNQLTLMDEVLTPDSSRYWPVADYEEAHANGLTPPSFDKQFMRDWLESAKVNGATWNKSSPAPDLPTEVIEKTREKYFSAYQSLCR